MKILIFTDNFSLPIDEGRKKVTYYLMTTLSKKEEVLTICNNSERTPDGVKKIKTNRLLISLRLKKEISIFKPDLILYIPNSSATIYSFMRAAILKKYGNNAKIVVIAHSGPINYKKHHRILLRLFSSYFSQDAILTPSPQLYDQLKKYRFNVRLVPFGVDVNKFKPADHKTKLELRKKYGVEKDAFIVLHVGHITKSRNLEIFSEIQKIDGVQTLIVGSESVPKDRGILKVLKNSGVKLITNYIDNIEEFYQLSDCYVFRGGAVSMPLSVFEAMACNLPVITNKFGILPILFHKGRGFIYCESKRDIIDLIIQIKTSSNREIGTRALVEQYSWDKLVEIICKI